MSVWGAAAVCLPIWTAVAVAGGAFPFGCLLVGYLSAVLVLIALERGEQHGE